jgi:hypothetical protein
VSFEDFFSRANPNLTVIHKITFRVAQDGTRDLVKSKIYIVVMKQHIKVS